MEERILIAVCFICYDGAGRYLIGKRSASARDEQLTWDFGGGGVRFREDPIDALRREIAEEYGTSPKNYQFLGYRNVVRNGYEAAHVIALDFLVQVDCHDVAIGEPEKCDELRWLSFVELLKFNEPTHSQLRRMLSLYEKQLPRE